MRVITEFDLDWLVENREEYIEVCGVTIHISEYPFIREVLRITNFKWHDCVPSRELILYSQQERQRGKTPLMVAEKLIEKNKARQEVL